MRDDKDRGSKWMIEHHGDAILRLGGISGFGSWRALQSEVVHPKQLPDGLLEVTFPGQEVPDLVLVEIATYPERRAEEQVLRDTGLLLLDRRVLPEVVTVVLHPKGTFRLMGRQELSSRLGLTRLGLTSSVIELWTVPAQRLLAVNDVGLIPWLPLTQYDDPPEVVLQQCREQIERQASPEEQANLLAVTQTLASLRYNNRALLDLLRGSQAMMESPLIQEMMQQTRQEMLLQFLEARFGAVPPDLVAQVRAVVDEAKLRQLVALAGRCSDLEAFRIAISS